MFEKKKKENKNRTKEKEEEKIQWMTVTSHNSKGSTILRKSPNWGRSSNIDILPTDLNDFQAFRHWGKQISFTKTWHKVNLTELLPNHWSPLVEDRFPTKQTYDLRYNWILRWNNSCGGSLWYTIVCCDRQLPHPFKGSSCREKVPKNKNEKTAIRLGKGLLVKFSG